MDKRLVLERVKAAADDIAGAPTFTALRSGGMPSSVFAELVSQYRNLSIDFPRILCTIAARIGSEEARLGLITNLWDEHGRGNAREGHRAMLDAFIERFDPNLIETPHQSSWQTRLFLNAMGGVAASGSLSEALGMLLFFEAVTPLEYRAVIAWLSQSTDLRESDWRFWSDHVEHDGDHLRDLLDLTVQHETLDPDALIQGVRQACAVEQCFWAQFSPDTTGVELAPHSR